MTTPPTSSSKVLLLPEARHNAADGDGIPVRRYRIARLRVGAPARSERRDFEYLKRSFD